MDMHIDYAYIIGQLNLIRCVDYIATYYHEKFLHVLWLVSNSAKLSLRIRSQSFARRKNQDRRDITSPASLLTLPEAKWLNFIDPRALHLVYSFCLSRD